MSILDLHPEKIMPEPNSGCWLWTGSVGSHGYGFVKYSGKMMYAHRIAFLLAEGYLPPRPSYHHPRHSEALVMDHLCRVRNCVNPDHLAVVTNTENKRRGAALITHCPQGHPYAGDNLYVHSDGRRICRECAAEHRRRHKARKKAAA